MKKIILSTILLNVLFTLSFQSLRAQTNLYSGFNPGFEGVNASATGNTPYYWWNFYNTSAAAATLTDETNAANIHSGSHAGKVVVGTAASNYQPQLAGQPVSSLNATHTYQITAWVKSVNGVGKIQACNGGGAPYLAITTITTSWMQYTTTFTGQTSFNIWFNMGGAVETFYIDDVVLTDLTVLPVTITSFTATTQGNNVSLNWQTANEVNNDYFNVEKSSNAVDFTSVGKVLANKTNTYSFTDVTSNQAVFYRLAQVDKDGKIVYSSVIAVGGDNRSSNLSVAIYPNPTLGQAINVKITSLSSKTIALQLTDVTGRIVATKTVDVAIGANLVSIDNSLQHGTYNLQVLDVANKSIISQIKVLK